MENLEQDAQGFLNNHYYLEMIVIQVVNQASDYCFKVFWRDLKLLQSDLLVDC